MDQPTTRREKPEGEVNKWGTVGLPHLLEQDIDAVQIGFPLYTDWTWDQVASGAKACDAVATRLMVHLRTGVPMLHQDYTCASWPSRIFGGKWITLLVHQDRTGEVSAHDSTWQFHQCTRDYMAQC